MRIRTIFRALLVFFGRPKKKPFPRLHDPRRKIGLPPEPVTLRPGSVGRLVEQGRLSGRCYVVDGDTIDICGTRVRLAGIDAPELDHPWGNKAKWTLVQLCKGKVITAVFEPDISYDRLVATCFLPDGRDLSEEMVKAGMALDWPKFSGGKYAHFEPADARRRHWKAAARQRGNMTVFLK